MRLRPLTLAALACLALPAVAAGHVVTNPNVDLPDLVADPPERPIFSLDAGENGEERLLLRFDGHVHNAGDGPLEVRKRQSFIEQALRGGTNLDAGDDPFDVHPLGAGDFKFENTDGHNHWHLQRIARYSLFDPTGTAAVAPVMKVGFCLIDSTHVDAGNGVGNQYLTSCGRNQPNATSVRMGVSAGWRDLYDRGLPFQYVDVSETQPGSYQLRSEVDPYNLVDEVDDINAPDWTTVAVPGFLAMMGDAWLDPDGDVSLSLAGNQYGTGVGSKQFRIVDPPQHGTLTAGTSDVTTGEAFAGPGVEYDGTRAPDRFRYVAEDTSSDYPRWPGRATVLLGQDPLPRVAMWGVPEKLRAGMTVDLAAEGRNASSSVPVVWSASAGTIDAGGRFTAPATPPPGGKVTVTATIDGGTANDAMDIEITSPPPPPAPAPEPGPGDTAQNLAPVVTTPAQTVPGVPGAPGVVPGAPKPAPAPRRTPIGSVRVRRIGPQISVAVTPRTSGRVRATLLRGRRKLGTCSVRVRANRSSLCRLRFRSRATAIALTLVRSDGKVERRRVKAPGSRS
jgi:Lysyl oxidase